MELFTGIVIQGSRRAATLGFPTINIEVKDAPAGIYAAEVTVDGGSYHAAAFGDPVRGILEAHLLNATGDYYGMQATITLRQRIRETRQYESDEALKEAITSDVAAVRAYFADV